MRRVALTSLLLAACFFGAVAPSWGHAVLEESVPARGAQLEEAPPEVVFTFNEPVEASLGAVRIFDTEGNQVQTANLVHPGGRSESVGAEVPRELAEGLYTATYRVVSADAHPVAGGITFTVGEAGQGESGFAPGKTISELIAGSETGPVTEVGFWLVRWIGYLAIALALGAVTWLLFVLGPRTGARAEAEEELLSRFRKLMLPVAAVGIMVSLAAIPFQGAIAGGSSFWQAFGSGIPGEVIDTRFGTVMLARAAAWTVLAGLVAFRPAGFRSASVVSVVGLLTALWLAVTPALAGHASTRDPGWLLIPSDIVHVAAMAVWTGGLVAMLVVLPVLTRRIEAPAERTIVLTETTMRFSAIALAAVALIGVSGAVQAILEVGSLGALLDTQFGRAVLIKIVLFAVLVVLGAVNRARIVPGLVRRMEERAAPGKPGRRLRFNLRLEVLLIVGVLGVTAALVSYPPPDAIQSGPASGSVEIEGTLVEYTVDPGRVGSNEIHVYLFDDVTGAPVPATSVEMAVELPAEEIAPIEVETRQVGPGHFVAPAATLGVKGEWLVNAAIRLSRFEETAAEFKVPVK